MSAPAVFDPVEFRSALPEHVRAQLHDTQRVTHLLGEALRRGWTKTKLIHECSRDLNGARNPGAVITRRLEHCASHDSPDKVTPRPPWCGRCDQDTRHVIDDNGYPSPARCPRCHPFARTKEAGG